MNKAELNEKIFAAALGCLDKKELLLFKETNSSHPDFAEKNFGAFQQLTALLPLILDNVEPEKGIKDRIARKVYRLKDNSVDTFVDSKIKSEPITTGATTEKIIVAPNETIIPENQIEIKEEPKLIVVNNDIKPVAKTNEDSISKTEEKTKAITERFEKINTLDDDTKNDIVITQKKLDVLIEDKKPKKNREERQLKKLEVIATGPEPGLKEDPEIKNKFFTILLVLISAVAMIGSAFLYIKFSSENDKYVQQISSLTSQLSALNEEASSNRNLISLLESRDLVIINMNPLQNDSTSIIKVLLNENTKSGFLQAGFSETSAYNQPLNLWSVSGMDKNLLITFTANGEDKFHSIKLPVADVSSEIVFIIAKAAGSDTASTSDSLLFSGSFLYKTK